MTLSGVIAILLCFLTEFDCSAGQLRHIGWRQTYNVRKILSPIYSLTNPPAARSLCDTRGVVGSLMIVLLYIFSWFWQWKIFENRLIFDEVKAYQNVPFLCHPVQCTKYSHLYVSLWHLSDSRIWLTFDYLTALLNHTVTTWLTTETDSRIF